MAKLDGGESEYGVDNDAPGKQLSEDLPSPFAAAGAVP
jgi:hypothetical protein